MKVIIYRHIKRKGFHLKKVPCGFLDIISLSRGRKIKIEFSGSMGAILDIVEFRDLLYRWFKEKGYSFSYSNLKYCRQNKPKFKIKKVKE